jgi:two-component system, NarL family, nitrate/nitrite response regulator NarL
MAAPGRVRVFIADSQPLFLSGVARAVQERPSMELVGCAADGRETVAALHRLRADIAVLDVRLNGLAGSHLLAAVARDGLPTRALFLTADIDGGLVYEALAAGAAGYLSKDMGREAILDAVELAAHGEVVLAPEAQTGIAREIQQREARRRPELSATELEILALAAEGSSTHEIAGRMQLSAAGVKGHLRKIYGRLGVTDRTSAVVAALRRGLLD